MIGERATTEAREVPPPLRLIWLPTSAVDISEKPEVVSVFFFLLVSDWPAGAALDTHWLRAMGARQWCRLTGAAGAAQARTRWREWIFERCDA